MPNESSAEERMLHIYEGIIKVLVHQYGKHSDTDNTIQLTFPLRAMYKVPPMYEDDVIIAPSKVNGTLTITIKETSDEQV